MTLLGLHRPDVVVRSPPAALRNAAPALGRQPGRWGGGAFADRCPGKKNRSLGTLTGRDELMDQNWIKPRRKKTKELEGRTWG